MTPLLTIQGLSFGYTTPILRGIDLSLATGENVALLGANGAGKTTLLRLCAGLLRPQQGEILFAGLPLSSYKPRALARQIALVPQEVQISFDFTVAQLVEQGRTPHRSSLLGGLTAEDRQIVGRAMELADVLNLAHRSFRELSGGERQRTKIALALAQQPKLLLLDEPAQHLDIGRQAEIFTLLRRLQAERITIVAAVHDLHSAAQYFSSCMLLYPDSSLRYGPPEQLLTPENIREVFGLRQQDTQRATSPARGQRNDDDNVDWKRWPYEHSYENR